jgi:hypothetical protein
VLVPVADRLELRSPVAERGVVHVAGTSVLSSSGASVTSARRGVAIPWADVSGVGAVAPHSAPKVAAGAPGVVSSRPSPLLSATAALDAVPVAVVVATAPVVGPLLFLPVWGGGSSTSFWARFSCSLCHWVWLQSPRFVGKVCSQMSHLNAKTFGAAGRSPSGVRTGHACTVGRRPNAELHLPHMFATERILMSWSLSRDRRVAVQLLALKVALQPSSVHSK